MRSLAVTALCVAVSLGLAASANGGDDPAALLASTNAADFERASEIYEARAAAAPGDYAARLGAAAALTQLMAVRTNGNLPLIDGLQDTAANRALWSELAPRALEHAHAALALRPGSLEAASTVATSYMFQASSMGIVRSILSGAAGEYRTNAERLIELDPRHEDALGDYLLASFYLVAPWPVSDDELARDHYERAVSLAPESVRNHYGFGVYWARQGEADRARPHFERALRIPCTPHAERLFCDWIKQTSKRALAELGSR